MEKEFIPYEQSLALKELGFDEKCISVYLTSNKRFYPIYRPYTNNEQTDEILRPLYQQAFRWFREKYHLCCSPEYILTGDDRGNIRFQIEYYSTPSKLSIWCNTYEKAELECLKKLIEIVKAKNL